MKPVMKLGFKTRINLCVVFLVASALTVLSLLSIINLKEKMTHGLSDATVAKLEHYVKELEGDIQHYYQAVEQGANYFTPQLSDDEINDRLKMLAGSVGISNIRLALEDGRSYMSLGESKRDDKVKFNGSSWYQNVKKQAQTITTGIYKDIITGKKVFSIASPIYENGQFIGAILGDILLDDIIREISNMTFSGGAATLSDKNQVFFASDDPNDIGLTPSQVSPNFQKLEDAFRTQVQGKLSFPYLGIEFDGYFQRIKISKDNFWTLMIFVDKNTALEQVSEAVINSVIIGLIMLTVSVAITYLLVNSLFKPLQNLKQAVIDLSNGNGDLTARLKSDLDDDIGQISEGFNLFIENLQAMMLDIADASVQISNNIDHISCSAKENEKILLSHSSETEQVVTSITELSESARSVAESVQQSSLLTEGTNQEAKNSKVIVTNAVETVRSLVDDVEQMSARIQTMNRDANQISAVLSVIGDISEQTNLLALNAAIEAARAGEQGRGFAVVADEVRALAARTQQSTSEISDMLARLLDGADKVVTAMDSTKSRCQVTAEQTSEVSGSLDLVSTSVTQIDGISSQISVATEQQSAVSEEISRNMLAIQGIVEALVQSGEGTVDITQALSSSNRQLETLVAQFKLNE